MKTIEPIPTLALDDLLHMAASAIEDLLEHTDPNTSYYSGAWADVPGKLRAAMLQAGNCRENGNSSTNNFREIAETSTGTAITPAAPDKKLTDDVQRDAKRWRALLGSARIRILGSAGFDATAHPGENPDYRHFGMEIWTHYPNWLHEKNEYGIDTLTQYADAMLAAAPQSPGSEPATVPGKWIPVSEQKPDCWCLTCRPVTLNDMRFVVCPDCGNKRCPRANDHRDACTGSNEPGQEGSVYPAAQQEVKGE